MLFFISLIFITIMIGFFKEYKRKKEARGTIDSYCATANVSEENSVSDSYQQNISSEPAEGVGTNVNEIPDNLGLMKNVLTQLGCQPEVNDDGSMHVSYQGENFHIDFGGLYAQIWDLGWAAVNVNDPELPKIREAINHTNFEFGPTVVITNPDEKGTMYVHSRLGILLHPAILEIDGYLRSNFDMFFRTKDSVRQNFQQITLEQQKAHEGRRPVGFTSTAESTEVSN